MMVPEKVPAAPVPSLQPERTPAGEKTKRWSTPPESTAKVSPNRRRASAMAVTTSGTGRSQGRATSARGGSGVMLGVRRR